jgi:hypothetical protein
MPDMCAKFVICDFCPGRENKFRKLIRLRPTRNSVGLENWPDLGFLTFFRLFQFCGKKY